MSYIRAPQGTLQKAVILNTQKWLKLHKSNKTRKTVIMATEGGERA